MNNTNRKKREVNPLGAFALVMAIIYSIPIVLMFFVKSRELMVLGMGIIPITIISFATAKTNFWKSPATNIRISYIGHMCFRLECNEQVVIIDPFKPGSVPGLKTVKGKANLVLYTEEGQTPADNPEIKVKKARKPLPFEVKEFVPENGKGRMYMLDNGDHKVVHLGSLSCDLTDEQKEAFKYADVLMIPVGGKYSIDEKEATALTLELLPEYVMPMSFKAATYGLDDVGYGAFFASGVREGWIKLDDSMIGDGEDRDVQCPIIVRLAAKNGKEKGLASVEVRNRDDE